MFGLLFINLFHNLDEVVHILEKLELKSIYTWIIPNLYIFFRTETTFSMLK